MVRDFWIRVGVLGIVFCMTGFGTGMDVRGEQESLEADFSETAEGMEGVSSEAEEMEDGSSEEPEGSVRGFSEEPEEIERAASESVAELAVYDVANNGIGRGSGFAAFSDRLLITNDHVLENADHLKVKTEAGDIFSVKAEDILIRDEDADLAICLLPEDCTLKALPVAEDIPLRGEKAVAIGSARGILNLVTIGNVSGHWSDAVVDWLLFSTPVSPGSSGGPLINDDGEVIGVVMGSYDDSQNLNFAVPIQEAGRLFGQLPEEY